MLRHTGSSRHSGLLRWESLREVNAAEAIRYRSVGLDEPASGMEAKVLGHQLVGVKAHLMQPACTSLLLCKCDQPGSDAASLPRRRDRHVLEVEMVGGDFEHEDTDNIVGLLCNPDPILLDWCRVVDSHRRGVTPD